MSRRPTIYPRFLGVDLNDLVPQPAWMRRPKAGMFAFSKISAKTPACVGPQFSRFFAKNYPGASRIADQYGVDVTLPLGLAANESGWGRGRMARIKNNPFGATPDGVNPVPYDSVSSAWDKWGQQWGRRIKGVGSDADKFLKELVKDNRHAQGADDNRGPYNTQDTQTYGSPDWIPSSRGAVTGVRKRLPRWLAAGC
jgi:hypothetical protein